MYTDSHTCMQVLHLYAASVIMRVEMSLNSIGDLQIVQVDSLRKCIQTFDGKVALLSNSAGLKEFDPEGKMSFVVEILLPITRGGMEIVVAVRGEAQ